MGVNVMAKIQEEVIVITVSRLLKKNETGEIILNEDLLNSIEEVVQELVGTATGDAIVEVTTGN